MNLFDFTVKGQGGAEVSLEAYRGKVLLVVNTATKCGLTPQYTALQELYDKYRDSGFEVLDFPCNQFKEQAPESDEEIQSFCTLNYQTTFPRFAKIDVNGAAADPLFVWLKQQAPKDKGNLATKAFEGMVKAFTPGAAEGDIKWNFGKFLISRDGGVAGRYSPAYTPDKLAKDIEAAGVTIMQEGWFEAISITNASHIKIRGLKLMHKRPPFTTGEIVTSTPESTASSTPAV